MEIILGLIALYLLDLLLDNLGTALFIALCVVMFTAVIRWTRNLTKTTNRATTNKTATSKVDKCSAGHCQYCNLGKAKKAGHSSNYCFCEFLKEYVQLKSECSYYKSRGCANGMCDYADFTQAKREGRGENVCYCNCLNKYVTAKDSCDLYSDEEAKEAIAILKGLSGN